MQELLKRNSYGNGWAAYCESKFSNLLFATGLKKRLEKAGAKSPIVVAAQPGYSATDLQRYTLLGYMNYIFAMNVDQGALSQLRAAVDPNVKSGEYYGPNGFRGTSMLPWSSFVGSYDNSWIPRSLSVSWKLH